MLVQVFYLDTRWGGDGKDSQYSFVLHPVAKIRGMLSLIPVEKNIEIK
jgi:hypothetical protein